jgi:hypothetical protein
MALWAAVEAAGVAQPGERLVAARRRRADWAERIRRQRLNAMGLTDAAFRTELLTAITAWCTITRWRRVPRSVALAVFPYVGRGFAARWFSQRPGA